MLVLSAPKTQLSPSNLRDGATWGRTGPVSSGSLVPGVLLMVFVVPPSPRSLLNNFVHPICFLGGHCSTPITLFLALACLCVFPRRLHYLICLWVPTADTEQHVVGAHGRQAWIDWSNEWKTRSIHTKWQPLGLLHGKLTYQNQSLKLFHNLISS